MILEDVLSWRGVPVWSTDTFEKRWNTHLAEFLKIHWRPDVDIQGMKLSLAKVVPIATLEEPAAGDVIEFIPNNANMKRLIWIPTKVAEAPTTTATATGTAAAAPLVAKKDAGAGPDVYVVWRGEERLGIALVRTLAISKALRLAFAEGPGASVGISANWNKQFEKWEILGVQKEKGAA